ncbi:MAG: hypothetical protein QXS02_00955 [Candidatus Thermoplasmatota archaeon]
MRWMIVQSDDKKKQVDLHLELVNKIDKILKEHEKTNEHSKREEEDASISHIDSMSRSLCIEDWKPLNKRIMTTEYISNSLTINKEDKIQPLHFTITPPMIGGTSAFRFVDRLEDAFQPHTPRDNWMHIAILPETNNNLLDRIVENNMDISVKKKSFNLVKGSVEAEQIPQGTYNEDIATMMKDPIADHMIESTPYKTTHITSKEKTHAKTKHDEKTHEEESRMRKQVARHKQEDRKIRTTKEKTLDKKELKKLKKLEKKKEKELKKQEKLREKELKRKQKKKEKEGKSLFSIFSKNEKKHKEDTSNTEETIKEEADITDQTITLDEDVKRLLLITDNLLAKLPDDVIESFAQSEDYSLYEKVMSKYKIK